MDFIRIIRNSYYKMYWARVIKSPTLDIPYEIDMLLIPVSANKQHLNVSIVIKNAWILSSVREREDVRQEALAKGQQVHFGDVMQLCHIKHSELPPDQRKYKGRIVFSQRSCLPHSKILWAFLLSHMHHVPIDHCSY